MGNGLQLPGQLVMEEMTHQTTPVKIFDKELKILLLVSDIL